MRFFLSPWCLSMIDWTLVFSVSKSSLRYEDFVRGRASVDEAQRRGGRQQGEGGMRQHTSLGRLPASWAGDYGL